MKSQFKNVKEGKRNFARKKSHQLEENGEIVDDYKYMREKSFK